MSDVQRRLPGGRPCEAEAIWFAISDLFYRELNQRGERAALLVARRALDAIAPPADRPLRVGDDPSGRDGAH